ncbi:MAG: TIGR03067 domain-containing protein [Gemmataceae bacterium]
MAVSIYLNAAASDDSKELAKLEGFWKVESALAGGEKIPSELHAKMGFTFKGDDLIPADNPKDVAKVKLDPTQKPAAIDLTEKSKKVSLGIYEVDRDTLKLCLNEPGQPRPKTFASAKGSRTVYLVLKRAKK